MVNFIKSFMYKFLYVSIVILTILLFLNAFYIVAMSDTLRNVFAFLTLVAMVIVLSLDINSVTTRWNKFLSSTILVGIALGGSVSILKSEIILLFIFV